MNQMPTLGGPQHLSLLVPDIRCAGCCWRIEEKLGELEGVSHVDVNYAQKRLTLDCETATQIDRVTDTLSELGYTTRPDTVDVELDTFAEERRQLLARLGVAGIGMMQVMMFALAGYLSGPGGIDQAYEGLMRWASMAITVPIVFYSAAPFHQSALRDLRNKALSMDVPVSLAILSAFFLSAYSTIAHGDEVYFDSACMFTFFLLTGRFLELNARKSYQIDRSLGEHLLPETADLENGDQVLVQLLTKGDRVKVAAGDVMPADGTVVQGTSSSDESAFTGETTPVELSPGSRVLAGTKNLDGDIVIEALSSQSEWTITHLSELYEKSAKFRPVFARLADRIARHFVAVVLLLAAGTALYWWQQGEPTFFVIALSVLVVSCPCALSLATPVAYTVASGAIRHTGVLVAEGSFLEKMSQVDTLVFDKTGTLTEGKLELAQVRSLDDDYGEQQLIDMAAAIEVNSLHPIAASLREHARASITATDVEVLPGKGVSGNIAEDEYALGGTTFVTDQDVTAPDDEYNWVLLSKNRKPIGWFGLRDRLREDADDVVNQLQQDGFDVKVYSGDSSKSGEMMVRNLGINEIRMMLSPEDKIDQLRELQAGQHTTLMIGDGINDTAAMAASDASLAINPVDVVVQSAADATLVTGNLQAIPTLLTYAKKVKGVIRQNLTWALVYNFSLIPLAMMGNIAPWVAALGMSMSSLLVTLNAVRLKRV